MNDKIKCPNCGHQFDVEEALSIKIEKKLKEEYEQKLNKSAENIRNQQIELEKSKEEFERKKEIENKLFNEKVAKELVKKSEQIENQIQETYNQKIQSLTEENEKRKQENIALQKRELEFEKREKALKDREETIKLETEKYLFEKQTEIENNAREKEREASLLREKQLQMQLDERNKDIAEMKRKAEQGSMQLQGEVQEVALEELLRNNFPFDQINEVPKGIQGADCIQTVINSFQQECGFIIYESKRTKSFNKEWIDKLKNDQINAKAEFAVIVTDAYPSDMNRFGQKQGVWICNFSEVKNIATILREMIIKLHSVKKSEENRGDKKEMLYNYLTSPEFVQIVNIIMENYNMLQNQIEAEKRAMTKQWSLREKQIDIVKENISKMFGSIKAFEGSNLLAFETLGLAENNAKNNHNRDLFENTDDKISFEDL